MLGRVFTCALSRGRGSERRRLHQSHLPGATCLRAERYKLMVIMLVEALPAFLRLHHKGLCENNDSVADLKGAGGESEPSACILKALTSVVKVPRAWRGGGCTRPRQSPLSHTSGSACSCLRVGLLRHETQNMWGAQASAALVRNGTTSTFEHEVGFCHREAFSLCLCVLLCLYFTCSPIRPC